MHTVNDGTNALTWLMSVVIMARTIARLQATDGLDTSCPSV